jgi:putative hydrolase of the HAD superfamily
MYDDVLPALTRIKAAGYRSAIVSNTPWGTSGSLWREELDRWGLGSLVDCTVFCEEVGFRKPAPEIFCHMINKLSTSPDRCLFVGDHPQWDVIGPQQAGMKAVLIDRDGGTHEGPSVRNLHELLDYLGIPRQF